MNIVVVGDGKVGLAITAQLSSEGHDLTVVDSNSKVLEQSVEQFDVMVVHGNGASLPTLREANADQADLLIAATSADEINLLTCILARRVGAKHTIARVRNPEYAEQLVLMREELGLSMTINPELSAAKEIYNLLQFPSFLQRDTFAKGKVEIVELKVKAGSRLDDLPLNKLHKILSVKVLVCAVRRGSETFIPSGFFVLKENDRIFVTAASRDLVKLMHNLNIKTQKIHSCMIIGGSRIAYYLSKMLIDSGISVKIVEKNPERCVVLSEMLPEAIVIEGDGSKQRLLLEEGLDKTDAFVTLTNIDEENIFFSLYAKHVEVPHVITKISRMEYSNVIQSMGIDAPVCPKLLCATEITRYVRAMANTTGGAVITMHELVDGRVHALEFLAGPGTKYLDNPLADVPIKKGILIACIIRKGRAIIPEGGNCIRRDDTLIIVIQGDRIIVNLNDIFEN
ncbi:MAG TPA: Trk system potassium transporter TrkA [Ruminococcaceae bacterium]|nr:Trk system potassium transporter TrkA [Oscillospiraceae bacterium]